MRNTLDWGSERRGNEADKKGYVPEASRGGCIGEKGRELSRVRCAG